MVMLRRFCAKPNPFSNCCWNVTVRVDCTDGLNRLAAMLDEERVLSQLAVTDVPDVNPWVYVQLYWAL